MNLCQFLTSQVAVLTDGMIQEVCSVAIDVHQSFTLYLISNIQPRGLKIQHFQDMTALSISIQFGV